MKVGACHRLATPVGSFRTVTTIPSIRRAGSYTVTGRCGGGNFGVLVHLRVTR